jgi:cytochrome c oxidase subunit 1/cytochrome c oxidase subunit I+III
MVDTAIENVRPAPDANLAQIWRTQPGFIGWLSSVDHKEIGKRYLLTAFAFLLVGGLEALVMRAQLAAPNQTLLTPAEYNQLFTMHGVTMVFLYALPMLSGFSNFLWPLLLGSRDMAFPRLNAFSYWVYLGAGIFIYSSFLIGQAPNAGWFDYVPLASKEYDPGVNIDVYALGLIFLGVSTTVGAVNFIVSLMRMRAPGMSINRMPILVWGTLTASVANLFAIPALSGACLLLWLDRRFGMHFYDPAGGGQPLLWQHLFWVFGHPWVYALVLPAMGIVSDALPTFCRRPLVGYTAVALATVATMVVGFGVWVHHMFATGLPGMALSFFGAASMIIAIPSAVSVFAWLGTIWTGRPVFKTPFYYFAGFILLFVMGGVSGFMTAAVPLDWQLTDTYFVVAHLHYVLLGINVFPVVGGLYYWFPKFTGRMADERLGKFGFWVSFIGFNVAFLPMHLTGLRGMPRRVYTYPAKMGWNLANMIITAGAFILAVGILITLINFVVSLRRGARAAPHPWDASTLEWSVASPPPPYNFSRIPIIASRHPLWEDRLRHVEGHSVLESDIVLDRGRESIATSVLDAEADSILKMPKDSLAPISLAFVLMVFFYGLLWREWWWSAAAGALSVAIVAVWLAPGGPPIQSEEPARG